MKENGKNAVKEEKCCCKCVIVALAFLTVWVFGALALKISCDSNNVDRYKVVSGAGIPTMMLDQQTGLIWRNVGCPDGGPANCWQIMTFEHNEPSFLSPKGMQYIRDKKVPKYLKEQEKLQKQLEKQAKEQAKIEAQKVKEGE